jgi:hypothetical protein
MSSRAAQLAIELTERGAEDVAGGFDKVTSSARSMGSTVDTASKQAETGAKRLDTTAESADELASKGSQAAGALGGLGGLMGGQFGAAMETGGVAMQAAADSGDLLNAALENSIVASARSKAATIAKTVADKASAAATKVMTVAQKALNIAQRSSPVLLIVTGVLLLVGAIVLAYKRSATFRAIVQGAMAAAAIAVGKLGDAFQVLVGVVKTVFGVIKTVIGTYIGIYVKAFELLGKGAVKAFQFLKDHALDAINALLAPVQKVIDLVQSLLDKISSIHLPHIPGNPFDRGGSGLVGHGSTTSSNTVNLTLNLLATPGTTTSQAAQQGQAYMDAIDARLRLLGRDVVFS